MSNNYIDAAQPVDLPDTTLIDTGDGILTLGELRSAHIESQEQRARRLFDEMARNIGREAVNHLKQMYPEVADKATRSGRNWERSLTNHIRNDINWRMRPLLMAMIAMHREWEEELP